MPDLELKIPPVLQVILFALAMWVLAKALPAADLSIPIRSELFALLVFSGFALAFAGLLEFRKANTTIDPRFPRESARLVVDGVYRISRNPMYLGMALALIGYGIYLANGAVFLMIPVFVLYMSRFQIVPEERAMLEKFGRQYQAYTARVRRWI